MVGVRGAGGGAGVPGETEKGADPASALGVWSRSFQNQVCCMTALCVALGRCPFRPFHVLITNAVRPADR